MIADEIDFFCAGLLQQFPDSIGIEPAQMGAQQAYLFRAAGFTAADVQNGLPGGGIKGLEIKAQLFHLGGSAEAGNPGKHRVNTVGGGAAHQSHYQPGGLVPKVQKRMVHCKSPFFF